MERKPIRKTDSISTKLLFMTLVPMLAMGIIITICASRAFTRSMCKEVSVELRNTAETVVAAYDLLYPGDYEMVGTEEVAIVKGEKVISTRSELIDRIKEKSGLEVSLFYYNTRIATTISDKEGNRLNGTVVNAKVEKEVLHKPIEKFYDNAVIDGRKYYAYYIPLFNSDNTCVGMVAVAKAAKEVNGKINQALLPIIIIAVLLMAVAAMITSLYAKQMINIFMSIRAYLNKVSDGRLDEEIDSNIMKRDDEIGEIGRSIMTMRNSLKEMVEIDTLTRVNNRRCGERKMKETVEQAVVSGVPYSIAIGDIDFFKKVNDRYGHECGDEVLKSVAHILKKSITLNSIPNIRFFLLRKINSLSITTTFKVENTIIIPTMFIITN